MGMRVNVTRFSPWESHVFTMYSGSNIQLGSSNLTAISNMASKHVFQESYQNGIRSNASVIENGKPIKVFTHHPAPQPYHIIPNSTATPRSRTLQPPYP